MTNPADHTTSIALHNQRITTLEQSLTSISKSLEKLTQLEMHHSETRHAITRVHDLLDDMRNDMSVRMLSLEEARKYHEDRLRKLEDADTERKGLSKSMGWLWGAIGGLVVIEVWRYLGGR